MILAGDSNLDAKVDLTDFTALAANFNGTAKHWAQGDFNYDTKVDLTDFTFLASNFNKTLAAPALGATVPEPTMLAAAAILMPCLLLRRRSACGNSFADLG